MPLPWPETTSISEEYTLIQLENLVALKDNLEHSIKGEALAGEILESVSFLWDICTNQDICLFLNRNCDLAQLCLDVLGSLQLAPPQNDLDGDRLSELVTGILGNICIVEEIAADLTMICSHNIGCIDPSHCSCPPYPMGEPDPVTNYLFLSLQRPLLCELLRLFHVLLSHETCHAYWLLVLGHASHPLLNGEDDVDGVDDDVGVDASENASTSTPLLLSKIIYVLASTLDEQLATRCLEVLCAVSACRTLFSKLITNHCLLEAVDSGLSLSLADGNTESIEKCDNLVPMAMEILLAVSYLLPIDEKGNSSSPSSYIHRHPNLVSQLLLNLIESELPEVISCCALTLANIWNERYFFSDGESLKKVYDFEEETLKSVLLRVKFLHPDMLTEGEITDGESTSNREQTIATPVECRESLLSLICEIISYIVQCIDSIPEKNPSIVGGSERYFINLSTLLSLIGRHLEAITVTLEDCFSSYSKKNRSSCSGTNDDDQVLNHEEGGDPVVVLRNALENVISFVSTNRTSSSTSTAVVSFWSRIDFPDDVSLLLFQKRCKNLKIINCK